MATDAICLKEADIIRLIQAYFDFRGLHLSLDALERESGIINCQYPEEALILRHLIVDGRWKNALHYLKRLPLKEEDLKFMTFEIMKQKYVELICVYEELGNELYEDLGNAIALCFSELSAYCPCPVEYENLRKLASLTKLSQDAQYKDWNPISSRRKCFQTICSVLLEMPGLGNEFREELMESDRLTDLLVKGIIYESCEDFCETKVNTQSDAVDFHFGGLVRNSDSGSSDLNLYSWLQSVPWVTMSNVFLNQTLTVKVDSLDQPKMKASWTEKILQNTTDLPEDVTRELRRPFSSSEDLKEHFWNKRIENNLIVDAPEILRRAEEVIGRWERRNSSTNINSIGDVRKNARKDIGEGDRKRTSGKLSSVKEKDTSMVTIPTGIERKASSDTSSRYCEGNNKTRQSSPAENFAFDVNSKITENSCIVENCNVPDSNDSLESNKVFDDKQNIRDLLKSKEKIRNKLLQILKNSTDDQNQKTAEQKSKESVENSDDSPSRVEISSELKHPFYVQPQLLRKEENNLQRIFKLKTVMDNSSIGLERRSVEIRDIGQRDYESKMDEKIARRRIDSLFGDNRHKYLVVCDEGVFLHDNRPDSANHHDESHKLSSSTQAPGSSESSEAKHNFVAVTQLEDEQAIRSVEFHPSGKFYAVGSNTKALRICAYPNCKDIRPDQEPREPTVLYKRQKHHKGSIYCMAWNATGDLLATGSNDKTVKLMRFNSSTCQLEDIAHPLTMHGGTVRDMCFMEDLSNRSNLLISGGSGDNKIYITDCETAMPFQSLTGHTGQILSLYTWGGVMFVSSSQDKTIRFWDMRTRGCVNHISARPTVGTGPGSAAATISVDPSGRLLVSGHEDSSCMLYDMKGNRILQTFKPHTADVRTARLSPKAFYLLTGSYDCKLMLTDLQGDLTQPLATVRVAEHADKVIQGRWHPKEFTFISTSADKTATLWALPQT